MTGPVTCISFLLPVEGSLLCASDVSEGSSFVVKPIGTLVVLRESLRKSPSTPASSLEPVSISLVATGRSIELQVGQYTSSITSLQAEHTGVRNDSATKRALAFKNSFISEISLSTSSIN